MAYLAATKAAFAGLIDKPSMQDKFLQKPPLAFIHDVFTNLQKKTKLFPALLPDDMKTKDQLKTLKREQKVAFIQLLIDAAELAGQAKLDVSAQAVVAGAEPEKTNQLLQALAAAAQTADKQRDSDIVKRVRAGERLDVLAASSSGSAGSNKENRRSSIKSPEVEKSDVSKDRDKSREKSEKRSSSKDKGDEKHKSRSSKDKDKDKSRDKDKDKSKDKDKDKKHRSKSKDRDKEKDKEKEKTKHRSSSKDKDKKKDKEKSSSKDKHKSTDKSKKSLSDMLSNTAKPDDDGASPSESDVLFVDNNAASTNSFAQPPSQDADPDLEDEPPPPKTPPKQPTAVRPGTAMARPGTSLGRPGTSMARPGTAAARRAPRIRRKAAVEDEQPVVAGDNDNHLAEPANTLIIADNNADGKDDDDDLVVDEPAGGALDSLAHELDRGQGESIEMGVDADQLDAQEHGGLVRTILENKKQLDREAEQLAGGHLTTVAFDQAERDKTKAEVDKLKASVQNLTRLSHPLARLLDYLQEDIDSMLRENEQWVTEYKQNARLLQQMKAHSLDKDTRTLQMKIGELDSEIGSTKEAIVAQRATIHNNEANLDQFIQQLSSRNQ